ncbi:MAG: hypothetical protein HY006_04450 [Candidatus Sungbacteria bacterium]|nr:hypothetical protein [Candidatus Sungbacteria bacterium]
MSSENTGEVIPNDFAKKYPNIAEWVEDGTIEIGQSHSNAFVSVYDEGGTVWEGKRNYATIDEALQEAEKAIGKWMKENL